MGRPQGQRQLCSAPSAAAQHRHMAHVSPPAPRGSREQALCTQSLSQGRDPPLVPTEGWGPAHPSVRFQRRSTRKGREGRAGGIGPSTSGTRSAQSGVSSDTVSPLTLSVPPLLPPSSAKIQTQQSPEQRGCLGRQDTPSQQQCCGQYPHPSIRLQH